MTAQFVTSRAAQGGDVPTVVHGVNTADRGASIISCASCTTNCITPVVEIIGRRIGIKKATMTSIHAYTSSQSIVDSGKKDFRRGRAGSRQPRSCFHRSGRRDDPRATGIQREIRRRGGPRAGAGRDPSPTSSSCHGPRDQRWMRSIAVFREEAASERYREVVGGYRRADRVFRHQSSRPTPRSSTCSLTQVVDQRSRQGHELVRQRMGLCRAAGARGKGRRPHGLR